MASILRWSFENTRSPGIWDEAGAVTQAGLFDIVSTGPFTWRKHTTAAHTANSNLKILLYMNIAFEQRSNDPNGDLHPDAWYAKSVSGDKLRRSLTGTWGGNWLMDVSHSGWIQNRIDHAIDNLETAWLDFPNPTQDPYDGVFLDLMGIAPLGGSYVIQADTWDDPDVITDVGDIPENPATPGVDWTNADYQTATNSLAQQIRTAIRAEHPEWANMEVWGNGLGDGPRYYDESSSALLTNIEGCLAESFLRNSSTAKTTYPAEAAWKQNVDMVAAAGDKAAVWCKLWVDATDSEIENWHEYALASFLLGSNGNGVFAFSPEDENESGRISYTDDPSGHQPTVSHAWNNINIGTPTGDYSTTNGVYHRDFTNGTVVVNPTGSSVYHVLNGTYQRLLDSSAVSSVTIESNRGAVFLGPLVNPPSILSQAEMLLEAKNYSGSGNWLDAANDHDGTISGALFKAHGGATTDNYVYFPGTAGNTVTVTLSVSTTYDYTVTYADNTTATGTETSDGSGVTTFGGTDVEFAGLDVKKIDVYPDGGGATVALFDASGLAEPFATYVDSLTKTWTINRSATGHPTTVIDQDAFLFDGDNDKITVTENDNLDFDNTGAAMTVLVAFRQADIGSTNYRYVMKRANTSSIGWSLHFNSTTDKFQVGADDDVEAAKAIQHDDVLAAQTYYVGVGRYTAGSVLEAALDGSVDTTQASLATMGTTDNALDLIIGEQTDGGGSYRGEIMAVVLWRFALTDQQISDVNTELLLTPDPLGSPMMTRGVG